MTLRDLHAANDASKIQIHTEQNLPQKQDSCEPCKPAAEPAPEPEPVENPPVVSIETAGGTKRDYLYDYTLWFKPVLADDGITYYQSTEGHVSTLLICCKVLVISSYFN